VPHFGRQKRIVQQRKGLIPFISQYLNSQYVTLSPSNVNVYKSVGFECFFKKFFVFLDHILQRRYWRFREIFLLSYSLFSLFPNPESHDRIDISPQKYSQLRRYGGPGHRSPTTVGVIPQKVLNIFRIDNLSVSPSRRENMLTIPSRKSFFGLFLINSRNKYLLRGGEFHQSI